VATLRTGKIDLLARLIAGATAIWIWPTITPVTKRVAIEPAQASTVSLSPFELMVTHAKNLPVENWPAL
jgi:hypothetical protein